jgi:coenzyme F420-reducing hydrogenase delta subunit
VRLIPVRCLGSVNVIWIKDALSQGMDGVFLLGASTATITSATLSKAANWPASA